MAHFRVGSLPVFGWHVAASSMVRIGMAGFLELSAKGHAPSPSVESKATSQREESHTKPRKENSMTRLASRLLDTNDFFPEMDLHLISGETLRIPRGLGDRYCVVLLYRGYW
jgi:hypothetical protein